MKAASTTAIASLATEHDPIDQPTAETQDKHDPPAENAIGHEEIEIESEVVAKEDTHLGLNSIPETVAEVIPVITSDIIQEAIVEPIQEVEPEVQLKPLIISRETEEIIFYIFNIIASNFNKAVFGEESDEEEEEEEEESEGEQMNIKINTVAKVNAPKKSHQNLFIQLRKEMIDPISMMRNFEKNDDDNVRALKLDILVQSENLLSKLAERRQK
jgi:hypothetical protein